MTSLRLLAALVSGIALAFAFPPYDAAPLAWFAPAALLLASLGTRRRIAFLCGFLHGAAFYIVTLSWVYTVMRVHGQLDPAAAAGVLALMVAVLALFPAAFALAVAHLGRTNTARALLAAPFVWTALELGRTHMPIIGFPWNLLGYALVEERALVQLAALTGIYGVSFLVAAGNAVVAWAALERRRLGTKGILALALAATFFIVGARLCARFVPQAEARHVAHLVQTNFAQAPSYPPDWMETHAADLDELERLSVVAVRQGAAELVPRPRERLEGAAPTGAADRAATAAEVPLIIWPEVPAPFSLQEPEFASRAEKIARESGAYFLVGVVEWKTPSGTSGRPDGPYNSVVLLDPAGRRVFVYDKIHLVPLGEYVPLRRWLTFAGKLTAEVGDFRAGREPVVGLLPVHPEPQPAGRGSGKFGALICYEAVFPAEVRRFVANGAELLVNVSNDGWFGRSAAPEQHLAMARMRAVETRRWLLRATNNGHTVAVDPYGRVVARLEPDRRGVLVAPYDFRRDRTLYARLGDWWAWLCVVVAMGLLVTGGITKSEIRSQKEEPER